MGTPIVRTVVALAKEYLVLKMIAIEPFLVVVDLAYRIK